MGTSFDVPFFLNKKLAQAILTIMQQYGRMAVRGVKMIKANLSHREQVFKNKVTVKFSELDFVGDREICSALKDIINTIKYERVWNRQIEIAVKKTDLMEQKILVGIEENSIRELIEQISKLKSAKVKNLSRDERKTKKERALRAIKKLELQIIFKKEEIEKLRLGIAEIEKSIEVAKVNQFYEPSVLKEKFEQFLSELGFIFKRQDTENNVVVDEFCQLEDDGIILKKIEKYKKDHSDLFNLQEMASQAELDYKRMEMACGPSSKEGERI